MTVYTKQKKRRSNVLAEVLQTNLVAAKDTVRNYWEIKRTAKNGNGVAVLECTHKQSQYHRAYRQYKEEEFQRVLVSIK